MMAFGFFAVQCVLLAVVVALAISDPGPVTIACVVFVAGMAALAFARAVRP